MSLSLLTFWHVSCGSFLEGDTIPRAGRGLRDGITPTFISQVSLRPTKLKGLFPGHTAFWKWNLGPRTFCPGFSGAFGLQLVGSGFLQNRVEKGLRPVGSEVLQYISDGRVSTAAWPRSHQEFPPTKKQPLEENENAQGRLS